MFRMSVWATPDLTAYNAWVTGVLMFASGVVMNAAGTGGGGVFVALLLSIGGLHAHEAVPMSKFIIFVSAGVTYLLNTVYGGKAAVIDFRLVRAIVPLSLAGTLIGVFVNTSVSERVLLCMLCALLVTLSTLTLRMTWNKFHASVDVKEPIPLQSLVSAEPEKPVTVVQEPESAWLKVFGDPAEKRLNVMVASLVPLVVVCGIISRSIHVVSLQWIFFAIPVSACVCVGWYLRSNDAGDLPFSFPAVGLIGGIVSGIFGLGGGLIYSPFLLSRNTRPDVAVAVSSTAVLLASASTALQYLFIGRIALAIGLFYAVFGVCSAIVATRLTRSLTPSPKGQYVIFAFVALAVVTSTAVTLAKTIITFGS